MAAFTTIRDDEGEIVGLRRSGQPEPETARPEAGPPAPSTPADPTGQRRLADLLPGALPVPPTVRGLRRREIAAIVVAGALALLAAALVRPPSHTVATATLTTAPAAAPVRPTALPVTPALPRLGRAVVAFTAPDRAVLGALEPDRPYRAIGRAGQGWVLIALGEKQPVWIRSADLPGVAVGALPDLAPPTPTAMPTPTALPPPAIHLPGAWPAPAAAPVGAPTVCDEASAPYHSTRQVFIGGRPVGVVTAWSCVSQQAADDEGDRQEQLLKGRLP